MNDRQILTLFVLAVLLFVAALFLLPGYDTGTPCEEIPGCLQQQERQR